MKIGLAQINPTVGAIKNNAEEIFNVLKDKKGLADLIIFPEMALSGYPAEDLIFRKAFLKKIKKEAEGLALKSKDLPGFILGLPLIENDKRYNSAIYVEKGEIKSVVYKYELPNDSVFDEKRVFSPATDINPININGHKIGLMICEDLWHKKVSFELKQKGAEALVAINASPFEVGKAQKRFNEARARIAETGLPLIYVNTVGGQDELVFDGNSFVMNKNAEVIYKLKNFEKDYAELDFSQLYDEKTIIKIENEQNNQQIYAAMKLGLADYVNKNGFKGVIIGMSGGIDSAFTAVVAVDALGADRVKLYMLPSPYTSKESIDDAQECANLLKCPLKIIEITEAMSVFDDILKEEFEGYKKDLTEENIQARIRGLILMAISNKTGYLLLTTGNKSETAVGYCTLYGDMCGGYNVIKDIYKTDLFKLVKWRNCQNLAIPQNIIDKPPSAELRENQKDEDTLPPYEILDEVLKYMIEDELDVEEIINKGYKNELVVKIWQLLKNSEFKRRQAPIGVKITKCAFGKERRYPITNAYKQ